MSLPRSHSPVGNAFFEIGSGFFVSANYAAALSVLVPGCTIGENGSEAVSVMAARTYLRVGDVDHAFELVQRADEFRNPDDRVEGLAMLALARAQLADFDGARATITNAWKSRRRASMQSLGELAHCEAVVAWASQDYVETYRALAKDLRTDDVSEARRDLLRGFTAARKGQMREYGRFALLAAERLTPLVSTEARGDIGQLASATRVISYLARELPPSEPFFEIAKELVATTPWTRDIRADQFQATRTLALAHALRGDAISAIRLMHEAQNLAPTVPWRVYSLVDRASIKMAIGEQYSARADLEEALSLSKTPIWHTTGDEERVALLYAAELLAPIDVHRAETLLSKFADVASSFRGVQTVRGGPIIAPIRSYVTGVVRMHGGAMHVAQRELKSAYDAFVDLGFAWRAARAAAHLAVITGTVIWRERARALAAHYPQTSQLAAEIGYVLHRANDASLSSLTRRQREVFRALCEGLTIDAISAKLGISRFTVKNHAGEVYAAFGASSQAALIAEARRRNLV